MQHILNACHIEEGETRERGNEKKKEWVVCLLFRSPDLSTSRDPFDAACHIAIVHIIYTHQMVCIDHIIMYKRNHLERRNRQLFLLSFLLPPYAGVYIVLRQSGFYYSYNVKRRSVLFFFLLENFQIVFPAFVYTPADRAPLIVCPYKYCIYLIIIRFREALAEFLFSSLKWDEANVANH